VDWLLGRYRSWEASSLPHPRHADVTVSSSRRALSSNPFNHAQLRRAPLLSLDIDVKPLSSVAGQLMGWSAPDP